MTTPAQMAPAPATRQLTPSASAHLDMARALAAVAVLFQHLRSAFLLDWGETTVHSALAAGIYLLAKFGHAAVVVFFVLSGFLIGSSGLRAAQRRTWSLPRYMLHRLLRLEIVLIPALFIGLFWDTVGIHAFHAQPLYNGDWHLFIRFAPVDLRWSTLLGNAAFLQTILVAPFGSNAPLWSLAYEFWYYVLYGLLVTALLTSTGLAWRLLSLALAIGAVWFAGPAIMSMAPLWFLGLGIYLLPRLNLSPVARRILLVSSILLFAGVMLGGTLVAHGNYTRLPAFDLLTGLLFGGVMYASLHANPCRAGYQRMAHHLSRPAYSLYSNHMPALLVLLAWFGRRHVPTPLHCLELGGWSLVYFLYGTDSICCLKPGHTTCAIGWSPGSFAAPAPDTRTRPESSLASSVCLSALSLFNADTRQCVKLMHLPFRIPLSVAFGLVCSLPLTAQVAPAAPAGTPPPQAEPQPPPPVQFTRTMPARPVRYSGSLGSTYIPLDSWMYPEIMRLYSLGYIDTVFLGMRPYTRTSVAHMLDASAGTIYNSDSDEAKEIYSALSRELAPDLELPIDAHRGHSEVESVYTRMLGITGQPLRDSYHAGQTIVNDYGRPYAEGFNNITGASVRTTLGRYSGYLRGEYQHAPTLQGYSAPVANYLSTQDEVPFTYYNPTIPYGETLLSVDTFRVQEAYLAANFASHEISIGKSDEWFGPGRGGGMGYSNNAENIYSIRINRVEPAHIPFISRFLGPVRYDFLYGSLQGHTTPNTDYMHSEGFSFKPTGNFEFGFERTIVFGGKGHQPVTWHTFLKGFFDINDTTFAEKVGPDDPGARFSAFNFSYRVPFVRNWLTFYSDSESHDDVTPISAPRRAALRPGLYLSHFPGAPKLSLRAEAVSTDPPTGRSIGGSFMYWEAIQRQAYTNKGFTFGDWIGREAKGGQGWLTYHISGNEWLEFQYRNTKSAKDFIPQGTTQNDFAVNAVKRLGKDVEVNAWVQYERWKAPFILNGNTSAQNDTSIALQITLYPHNIHRY